MEEIIKSLSHSFDNVPEVPSNVVRVFISSTFTDTKSERDYILLYAQQELVKFCAERGLDFQLVDMRWGVKDTAANDHSTEDICLKQIRACKNVSAGPNFVCILGNKYGYVPVRRKINMFEYQQLQTTAKNNGIDFSAVDSLYKLDTNADPQQYSPLKISDLYPMFTLDWEEGNADREKWKEHEVRLKHALSRSASKQKAIGRLSKEAHHLYFQSVTESELNEGLLKDENNKSNCIIILRNLTNVKEFATKHPACKPYVDFDGKVIDNEKFDRVDELKRKVREHCDPNHLLEYTLDCTENGIDAENPDHRKYLNTVVSYLVKTLKRLIEAKIKKRKAMFTNSFVAEVIAHSRLCIERVKSFYGRKDQIKQIFDRINDATNCAPIIIYAEPGSGKTSLMSMIAKQINQRFPHEDNIIIVRFLGISAQSTLIQPVLSNIIYQLSIVTGVHISNKSALQNYAWLSENFSKMLFQASQETTKRIFILLDSLNELSPSEGALKLIWLPKMLPPKVHVLVSTTQNDTYNCLRTLTNTVKVEKNFIQIKSLPSEVGLQIANEILRVSSRKLQSSQMQLITEQFVKSGGSPLYLKLLMDEALTWKSYTKAHKLVIPTTVDEMIARFYEKLETTYGYKFVAHTLSYLFCAKHGLSDNELEDILSLDNKVLQEVYQYWPPPNKYELRIPPLLWARIKLELGEQLVERQADGVTIIAFFHRQFPEVAEQRYLNKPAKRQYIHQVLSEYFSGKYSFNKIPENVPIEEAKQMYKPIKLIHIGKNDIWADRKPRNQDIIKDNVYNYRKMTEYPYHLLFSGNINDLFYKVLANYEWLNCKIRATSVLEVISDFNECLYAMSSGILIDKQTKNEFMEVQMIRDCLRLCRPAIERATSMISECSNDFAHEFIGRMLSVNHTSIGPITTLLNEARKAFMKRDVPKLIPKNTCYPSPSRALRCTLHGHTGIIRCLLFTMDGDYLISGSDDCTVRVWNMETDELSLNFDDHTGPIRAIAYKADTNDCLSASEDNLIYLWNILTGEVKTSFTQEIVTGFDKPCFLATTSGHLNNQKHFFICVSKQLNLWDLKSEDEVKPESTWLDLGQEKATSLRMSNFDLYLALGLSNGKIYVYNMRTLRKIAETINSGSTKIRYPVFDLVFTIDEKRLIYCSEGGCGTIALSTGENFGTFWDYPTRSLAVSLDGKWIASGGGRGLGMVFVWKMDLIPKQRDVKVANASLEINHVEHVGSCDVTHMMFNSSSNAIVSTAKAKGSHRKSKCTLLARILSEKRNMVLEGLTGKCTGFAFSSSAFAVSSSFMSTIKIFQVDEEWAKLLFESNVFIYRNPSDKEAVRGDATVVGQNNCSVLIWNERMKSMKEVAFHPNVVTCLAVGPRSKIVSGDHGGNVIISNCPDPVNYTKSKLEICSSDFCTHVAINAAESHVAIVYLRNEVSIYDISKNEPVFVRNFSSFVVDKEIKSLKNTETKAIGLFNNTGVVLGGINSAVFRNAQDEFYIANVCRNLKSLVLSASQKCVAFIDEESNDVTIVNEEKKCISRTVTIPTRASLNAVVFSLDDQYIFAASTSYLICVMDIKLNVLITYAFAYDQSTSLSFDGEILCSGMSNGQFLKLKFCEKNIETLLKEKSRDSYVQTLISTDSLFKSETFTDFKVKRVAKTKGQRIGFVPDENKIVKLQDNTKSKKHKFKLSIVTPIDVINSKTKEENQKQDTPLSLPATPATPGRKTPQFKTRRNAITPLSSPKKEKVSNQIPRSAPKSNQKFRPISSTSSQKLDRKPSFTVIPSKKLTEKVDVKKTKRPKPRKNKERKSKLLDPTFTTAVLRNRKHISLVEFYPTEDKSRIITEIAKPEPKKLASNAFFIAGTIASRLRKRNPKPETPQIFRHLTTSDESNSSSSCESENEFDFSEYDYQNFFNKSTKIPDLSLPLRPRSELDINAYYPFVPPRSAPAKTSLRTNEAILPNVINTDLSGNYWAWKISSGPLPQNFRSVEITKMYGSRPKIRRSLRF